ncbi:hypothetical protein [Arenibaculum sp.]|jgi:hypothetical protein|uniref:hypothetical protein n=1 Tax=Arenibaculum sp. TaxID=2865862 RepID=UPI002E136124|nr:hypothetical protein [Arenibaculum sp.]
MAQKAGAPSHSDAPDSWLLNPSVIIIAVCTILVLAFAPGDERSTVLTLLVVGIVCFVAGRLSASTAGPHAS